MKMVEGAGFELHRIIFFIIVLQYIIYLQGLSI